MGVCPDYHGVGDRYRGMGGGNATPKYWFGVERPTGDRKALYESQYLVEVGTSIEEAA